MKNIFFALLIATAVFAEENCAPVNGVKGDYRSVFILESCGDMNKARNAAEEFAKTKFGAAANVVFIGLENSWYHFVILD